MPRKCHALIQIRVAAAHLSATKRADIRARNPSESAPTIDFFQSHISWGRSNQDCWLHLVPSLYGTPACQIRAGPGWTASEASTVMIGARAVEQYRRDINGQLRPNDSEFEWVRWGD